MAARQHGQNKPLALLVSGVLIALVVLFIVFTKLQRFSYAKLTPLSVELALLNKREQSLIVEYDYGYGFNTGHSQEKRLLPSTELQVSSFTISSWKKIKKIRVRVTDQNLLSLNSVTLQKAGSIVRVLDIPNMDSALQIVFQLDDVSQAFNQGGGANAVH